MFNFRNDRGRSPGGPEAQRRERGPEQRTRDDSLGSGSEDWGQEWGEDWRGDNGQTARPARQSLRSEGGNAGRDSEGSRQRGPWYQQDTPAGQRRGSSDERGYGAADMGGAGHPYSSSYGGYRGEQSEPGYGYRDEDRLGPRGGRRSEAGERDPLQPGRWSSEEGWSEHPGRAMHWREGMERDRAQRGGQPSYGGGYFGDAGSGGQSYNGGQRVYPDDPGYRRRAPYAGQAGGPGTQGGQQATRRPVGPKGYRRADERVREDVCERLAMNPYVDVSEVSVDVANGVVTLDGTVQERREKYVIEEIADAVFGVTEVDNRLRVQRQSGAAMRSEAGGSEAAGGMAGGTATSGAAAAGTSSDRTLNKS